MNRISGLPQEFQQYGLTHTLLPLYVGHLVGKGD
jgi:hypothetical protein